MRQRWSYANKRHAHEPAGLRRAAQARLKQRQRAESGRLNRQGVMEAGDLKAGTAVCTAHRAARRFESRDCGLHSANREARRRLSGANTSKGRRQDRKTTRCSTDRPRPSCFIWSNNPDPRRRWPEVKKKTTIASHRCDGCPSGSWSPASPIAAHRFSLRHSLTPLTSSDAWQAEMKSPAEAT